MSPVELGKALKGLDLHRDPRLVLGYGTADDASAFHLHDGLLLLQTLDFFTPVVDDPYIFGRISAANSLSDIYAMGAEPLTALNIVSFPKKLGMDILNLILKGGASKAAEAGIAIAGGHTVDDEEPKYGLAATGIVHVDKLVRNSDARPGDAIILTKPLGSGVLTTALKKGDKSENDIADIISVMEQLNDVASRLMVEFGAHACTDVTGFGFLGHLWEMCKGSSLQAIISSKDVPILEDAILLAREWKMPGGSFANIEYLKGHIDVGSKIDDGVMNAMYDAQTSGGLIISIEAEKAPYLVSALSKEYPYTRQVGFFREGSGVVVE